MAIVSSFDQWEKDVFFSAAEEVQQSTDLMESLYRTWQRDRTSGTGTEDLEDLSRELHMALGTAKWQLEQFERAVRTSHQKYPSQQNTITRHKQFISAIKTQINKVQTELNLNLNLNLNPNNSLTKDINQNFTWVELEKEERDDFISFLSTPNKSLKKIKERERENPNEVSVSISSKKNDEQISIQIDKSISSNELQVKSNSIEVFKKFDDLFRVKLLRNNFWKAKSEENYVSNYFESRGVVTFSQFGRSLRVTLMLLLSIFLIVPFVIYSRG